MRIDRDEQVGLLTCAHEHHSLLLDSRDHWDDVVQDRKPRERRCRCGERAFEVDLTYDLRDDGDVRSVAVELCCVGCRKRTLATTFEIDYSPTAELLSRPLETCEEPWLIPKRCELSALWVPGDRDALVRHLGERESARCYLAGFRQPLRLVTAAELPAAEADGHAVAIYLSTRELAFPDNLRDCWKRLPVIHVSSPTTIHYTTGTGHLYYVQWAKQVLVERRLEPQEAALLALADRLQAWLRTHFTSARYKHAFDNPTEYERLQGGW